MCASARAALAFPRLKMSFLACRAIARLNIYRLVCLFLSLPLSFSLSRSHSLCLSVCLSLFFFASRLGRSLSRNATKDCFGREKGTHLSLNSPLPTVSRNMHTFSRQKGGTKFMSPDSHPVLFVAIAERHREMRRKRSSTVGADAVGYRVL